MKKIIISLILVLGFNIICKAQTNLNDYKYVIVESQFHFQNEPNEFDLNELTRYLLKKQGFKPILDSGVYPDDLKANYCLALTSQITSKGTFTTKVKIVFKDCDNNILFSSEGITKEKEFKKVYNIGIRNAIKALENINYKYIPNADIIAKGDISKDEIEELKAEIKNLKTEQSKISQNNEEVNEAKELNEVKELKDNNETNVKLVEKTSDVVLPVTVNNSIDVKSFLEAKQTIKGFELKNNISNKVEFIIYKTGIENVFIIKDKDGLIYKKVNQWVREYVYEDKTVIESLDIRF